MKTKTIRYSDKYATIAQQFQKDLPKCKKHRKWTSSSKWRWNIFKVSIISRQWAAFFCFFWVLRFEWSRNPMYLSMLGNMGPWTAVLSVFWTVFRASESWSVDVTRLGNLDQHSMILLWPHWMKGFPVPSKQIVSTNGEINQHHTTCHTCRTICLQPATVRFSTERNVKRRC